MKNRKEYLRAWYQKHKDDPDFKAKTAKYRQKHRLRYNKQKRLWKQNNPQKNIWSNAKYRAKRVGLKFNIEISDIIIPKRCPYLGVILTSEKLKGHLDTHMSLDRIDSTKGYIKGNVEVISYKANMMKQDATWKQLITFAQNILKRTNQ